MLQKEEWGSERLSNLPEANHGASAGELGGARDHHWIPLAPSSLHLPLLQSHGLLTRSTQAYQAHSTYKSHEESPEQDLDLEKKAPMNEWKSDLPLEIELSWAAVWVSSEIEVLMQWNPFLVGPLHPLVYTDGHKPVSPIIVTESLPHTNKWDTTPQCWGYLPLAFLKSCSTKSQ